MSDLVRLDPALFIKQAWANGQGHTLEIASGPDANDKRWRLSIAHIQHAAPFSALPGVQRDFVPLDAPIRLHFADSTRALLRLQVTHFDGAEPPRCELPDGPTRAFNLMRRHDQHGRLIARPLQGSMWLPSRPGCRRYLHLIAGHANLHMDGQIHSLSMDEPVWITSRQARLEGGGEIVLVELDDTTPTA